MELVKKLFISAAALTFSYCGHTQEDFYKIIENHQIYLEEFDFVETKLNKKEALERAIQMQSYALRFSQQALNEIRDRDAKLRTQLYSYTDCRAELVRIQDENRINKLEISKLKQKMDSLQRTIKYNEAINGQNINWALLSQYDTDFFKRTPAWMIQQTRYLGIATAVAELYNKWNDLSYCDDLSNEMAADNYSYCEVIGTDMNGGDDIAILQLNIYHGGCDGASMSLVHLERSASSENVLTISDSKVLFEYSNCEFNDEFIWPEMPYASDVESAIGIIDKWLESHNFALTIIKGSSCPDVTIDYVVLRERVIEEGPGYLPPINDLFFSGDIEFVARAVDCETAAVTSITNMPNGNVFVNYGVFLGYGFESAPGEDHYVLLKN